MQRLDLGLHSHPKEFLGNGVGVRVNSKRKIPSIGKILLRGGPNPQRYIKQDSGPKMLPTELFLPPRAGMILVSPAFKGDCLTAWPLLRHHAVTSSCVSSKCESMSWGRFPPQTQKYGL